MKKMKKMSLLLSTTMLASTLTAFSVSAQAPTDVVLSGRYETNIPISVSYKADGNVTIRWEKADSDKGPWTVIEGATGSSYTGGRSMGLKWVRAGVTSADGKTTYSKPKQFHDRYWAKKQEGSGATHIASDKNAPIFAVNKSGATEESSPDVIFNIDGDDYLLLDVTEDANSHFLVVKREAIGNHKAVSYGQLMTHAICWLNNKPNVKVFADQQDKGSFNAIVKDEVTDYSKTGGYRTDMESLEPQFNPISPVVVNYIDEHASWKQEPRMWEWGDREIIYKDTGIFIPTITDYERYAGKLGWKDFRTMQSDPDWSLKNLTIATGHANQGDGSATLLYNAKDHKCGVVYPGRADKNAFAIRPMFFLKDNFFMDPEVVNQLSAQIADASLGVDVKRAIANSASLTELGNAGYDVNALKEYVIAKGELKGITADGIYKTSLKVHVIADYTGNMDDLEYTVFVGDTKDGNYREAKKQLADPYVQIPANAGKKYVKFSVKSPDGTVFTTEPKYINDTFWNFEAGYNPSDNGKEKVCADGSTVVIKPLDTVNEKTPAEYLFTIDGQDFIMLDTTESNESKFFVMSKNIVSGEPVAMGSGQDYTEFMNFLNSKNGINGYLPTENYPGRTDDMGINIDTILPESVLANINYNQTWKVERRMWESSAESMVEGGISVPAMHEVREYSHKIGLWDDKVDWWVRTPYGPKADGNWRLYCSGSNFGAFFHRDNNSEAKAIRPVFYLDRSMFTDKVYDLSVFGVEAMKALRDTYTRDELKAAGYTEQALSQYYDVQGDLTAAKIDGIFDTSLPVKVDFEYSGSNPENIKINWYQADTADGEFTLIGTVSGKDNNFRIPYSAAGKFIKGEAICIPTGKTIATEAKQVGELWKAQAPITHETQPGPSGMVEGEKEKYDFNPIGPKRMPLTTSANYTFTYNGIDYILLDVNPDSVYSRYLVLTKVAPVKRAFDEVNNNQTFENLIGWLNDLDTVNYYAEGKNNTYKANYKGAGFLSSANAPAKEIQDHINWNQNWKTERKMWEARYERAYEGGIAIPSYHDLYKYAEKIGAYDAGNASVWTRTPNAQQPGDGGSVLTSGINNEFAGYYYAENRSHQNLIRPMFWLDKDFFTTVRVENIGVETATIIKNDVAKADMQASGLYTDAEIEEIYKDNTPPEEDYVRAEFANVKEGGTVTATIKMNFEDILPWVFVVAVYDANGKLLGTNFAYEAPTLAEDGIFTKEITVANVPAGEGNVAKVFCWDDIMYPLNPVISSNIK